MSENLIVLCQFVRILDHGGAQEDVPDEDDLGVKTQGAFQNGYPGKLPKLPNDPTDYQYLGFVYQGAALTTTGDNLQASLYLANNALTMSLILEGVQKKWQLKVETHLMDPSLENGVSIKRLAMEKWLMTSMNYDYETIEITLSSAIDAITAGVPQRTLSQALVGDLPTTGNINTI